AEQMLDKTFFFTSRRRHTRSKRDWSSDVCSSDLSPQRVFQYGRRDSAAADGASRPGSEHHRHPGQVSYAEASLAALRTIFVERRSEERRVGKECRCEW